MVSLNGVYTFSKYNLHLKVQVKHLTESFGNVSLKILKSVIEGFVLSHVLRPLSHAGVIMQWLDNPEKNKCFSSKLFYVFGLFLIGS